MKAVVKNYRVPVPQDVPFVVLKLTGDEAAAVARALTGDATASDAAVADQVVTVIKETLAAL